MTGQIQPSKGAVRPLPRPHAGQSAAMSLTPKEIVGILRRHIWLMIILTIVGVIISTGLWFAMKTFYPKYTARTFIHVLPPGQNDPMAFGGVLPNKELYFELRATKAAFMKELGFLERLLRRDTIRGTEWFKQFDGDITDAIENLEDNLGASPRRDGTLISVSMRCGSKKESALIVNEMVDLFLREQHDNATADISKQLTQRRKNQQKLQQEIDNDDRNLAAMRTATKFTNLGKSNFRDHLNEKLTELEENRIELNSEIAKLKSNIEIIRERADWEYDEVIKEQIEYDTIARSMRDRIAMLQSGLAQQQTRFGENHRRVRETRDALKQMEADLVERQNYIAQTMRQSRLQNAEDTLITFSSEIEMLNNQYVDAMAEYKELFGLREEYERIVTNREERRIRLEKITENIEKLEIQYNNPDISKVKATGLAPQPREMSSPKMIIYIPGGFMLGFMAGVGLAFAIEMLNTRLRTPSDIVKYLRVPLLGTICHCDEDDGIDGIDPCHAIDQAPHSIMSECYRHLRTNLKQLNSSDENKIILISSCGAGCGKTTVATNMASTFAVEDKKVLFIDSNFRRSSTATIFPAADIDDLAPEHIERGLSDYLSGQCGYTDIIRPSGIAGIDVIDSGSLPSNPAEALGNSYMKDLLEQVCQNYDYVIIDGPPLLVSDAKTLAAQANGTILVFNATNTRRGEAQRVLRELREINAKVLGVVLLGVRAMKGGYFEEFYRSYQEYQEVAAVPAV